jgi:hypothetical protein
MPETMGKRQRRDARTRKIAAKEERRVARSQRRELRAAGIDVPPPGTDTDEQEPWPDVDEESERPAEAP